MDTQLTKNITRSVTVIVRHSKDCKPGKGKKPTDHVKCDCNKTLVAYNAFTDNQGNLIRRCFVSAKTSDWREAEKLAQAALDKWNPEKQELARLKAEKKAKELQRKTIEEAVALIVERDMIEAYGDNGTVKNARSLFGRVDPETHQVLSPGHLFTWLNSLPSNRRPVYISDITLDHLMAWRSTWEFNDLTKAQRWQVVNGFFNSCVDHNWISSNPIPVRRGKARNRYAPQVEKGNRKGSFTDEQVARIIDAAKHYRPTNVPEETGRVWQQRSLAFVYLLRYSGMALVDAVQFNPAQIDNEGVLEYVREKTGTTAAVQLPFDVAAILREVPLELNSVGPHQPFRSKDIRNESDRKKWSDRLKPIFELAGIKEVATDLGKKEPSAHMFRDTLAMSLLRAGKEVHTVKVALGHSSIATTEKSYMPKKASQEAALADMRNDRQTGLPAQSGKVVNIASSRVQ